MIVYTLWHRGDDEDAPWIVDAIDEYTIDNNCEFPPEYRKRRDDINVRELVIDVPEGAVRALFEQPTVKAKVLPIDKKESHEDPDHLRNDS